MSNLPEAHPQGNLPAQLSSFIGRTRDIAEVKRLLSGPRMLTLTGPGGCGKTRLSIQVANDVSAAYSDGVWMVELAPLSDPHLVPQAVASALGLHEQASISVLAALIAHLRPRHILLVLDNCEHLLDACAHLSQALLENCPGVRLLATSRAPLGVPGEAVWVVPPLSLPDPQPWISPLSEQASLSAYEQSEAIQLFTARATSASAGFVLTAKNAPWAANICRRLDGLPLAIELAAARVPAFSLRQIAERLGDRFQLLTGGPRTAPARQQTLQAALDWSHALLSDEEQRTFRRLSVFAGGWSLEAAEQVCSAPPADQTAVLNVATILADLVDKSLVAVEHGRIEPRYRYLETVRQYAWQKLTQAGEIEPIRDRHLDYFTRWSEQNETHFYGPGQAEWVVRFSSEHDNLRSALDWSQAEASKSEHGLRLAVACTYFWKIYGNLNEGRTRLLAALDRPIQQQSLARVRALLGAASLSYSMSDFPAIRPLGEEALLLSRSLGSPARAETAKILNLLGELATEVGEHEKAPPYLEEALAIFRELGDQGGVAEMLMQLGWAAMRVGNYAQASAWLNECLPTLRQQGETRLIGYALAGLGELAIRQGEYAKAVDLLEQSLALRRELGDRLGLAISLGSLGWVALRQRQFDRMQALLGESLSLRMEIGEIGGTAWCLEKLAQGACLESQDLPARFRLRGFQRAASLFGAAEALRRPINSTIDPTDLPEYEALLQELRSNLGSEVFKTAWQTGRRTPLPENVALALSPLATEDEFTRLSQSQADKAKFGGLSSRERQAAVYIAQGRSNREIADLMFVRVKTIETYVTRILNKLGFDSRVQIATWALETGLTDRTDPPA